MRTVTAAVTAVLVAALAATLPASQPQQLPAAATPGEVHLTAAGDYADGANASAVLQRIAALDPDLNLVLGDLSYKPTGTEQAWCDFVTDRVGAGFPFELLAGNHESNGLNGNINDFSACLPNQLPGLVGTYGRQWYVDVPAEAPLVRLVMISPDLDYPGGTWSYAAGTPRYAWTAAAIDGARASGVPWVVVGMHKVCLSAGQYPCEIGADLENLLLAKKVDLVLTGHEHLYQRSAQLGLRTGCSAVVPGTFDPDCVVDDDDTLVRGAGTVQVTVGTGGIAQRAVNPDDPEAPYFVAASGLATATWGVLDLRITADRLTARFERASGGTFTDAFTIEPPVDPPANEVPTASFTASCQALTCALDAAASADPDGTIASYAWTFGDGATATGRTAQHTYGAGGTYTVRLTVTDDDGATGTTTRSVSVSPATAQPFALDTFTRTAATGWGAAEVGGTWRTTGSSSQYAVTGSAGRILFAAPGAGPDVSLPGATSTSTDLTLRLSVDKRSTGSGLYVAVDPRRVGTAAYRTRLQLRSDGSITLALLRTGSPSATLTSAVVLPTTYAAGDALLVRTQATGTSPTTFRAKVWHEGTAEPVAWQASATDAGTALQTAGHPGVNFYLSSGATNTPLTLLLDDVRAVPVE